MVDLTRILKLHVGLLGATGGLAYATHSLQVGSLLLGGAVMGLNVWLLRLMTNGLRPGILDPGRGLHVAVAVGAFVLKFAVFVGLAGLLFWRLPIEGLSFATGVTLLLIACLLEVARHEWCASADSSREE